MRTLFPRRYAKNAASLRRPPQEPPGLPAPRVPRALPQLPRPLRPPRRRALLDPSLLPSRVREQRRIACRDFAPLENMPLLCFRSGSGGSFFEAVAEAPSYGLPSKLRFPAARMLVVADSVRRVDASMRPPAFFIFVLLLACPLACGFDAAPRSDFRPACRLYLQSVYSPVSSCSR